MEYPEEYMRQLDLWNPRETNPSITLVGAGSIGSFTALVLTKMGIKRLELYDWDRVEKHNISNQFFRIPDLGAYKVVVTKHNCKEFSPEDVKIKIHSTQFNKGDEINSEVAIVCTDNMESRGDVFESCKKSLFTKLLIDARMGGEIMHIFCVDPHSERAKEFKKDFLGFKNRELPCTARTIIYNVLVIAGLIADFVKKYAKKEKVPFHVVYDLKTLEQIVTW